MLPHKHTPPSPHCGTVSRNSYSRIVANPVTPAVAYMSLLTAQRVLLQHEQAHGLGVEAAVHVLGQVAVVGRATAGVAVVHSNICNYNTQI